VNRTGSALHMAIQQAWDCAFLGAHVTYLSGPITTGLRQIEQIRAGGENRQAKHRIIQENSEVLIDTARKLRLERTEIIVEPGSLNVAGWSQADYLNLWEGLIERHVRLILFMPDWEYSLGCAVEFARAVRHDVRTEAISGSIISVEDGIALLAAAVANLRADNAGGALVRLVDGLETVIEQLSSLRAPVQIMSGPIRKDESLDYLSRNAMNVAQFVSYTPETRGPKQGYSRVLGYDANVKFGDIRQAVATLLDKSADGSVNIRSYEKYDSKSRTFIYGLTRVDEAVSAVERLSGEGLHTIVNETINVNDGGVSGVLMGNVIEFAPDDTPRCVEKPGTASLPRGWGRELLAAVYRFPVDLAVPLASRLEFSLHPQPRGYAQTNTVTWEFAATAAGAIAPQLAWPNKFSMLVGDKVFGLLVAHHIGLPVPLTSVITRRVAPFSFGRSTGSGETWIRTAPPIAVPGKFTTHRGWIDPFRLLHDEDAGGNNLASVLSQEGVRPHFSGAMLITDDGELVVEGKYGEGESLMQGINLPVELPGEIVEDVRRLSRRAEAALGPVRIEWVHDGKHPWVVQLHVGATTRKSVELNIGEAASWIDFDVAKGLVPLRALLDGLHDGIGIRLNGRVGLTSHIAEVIRNSGIPARMIG
jgi:hypothetical protein